MQIISFPDHPGREDKPQTVLSHDKRDKHMMNISTKQLRAFMALYKQRNFTRAASSIHLSQPAFSALITSLEEETTLRLFNRDTRSVSLTADGEAFIPIAERMLHLYSESIRQIEAQAHGEQGRVRIAALPSITVCWLSSALAEYWKRYPDVKVELLDAVSDRCLQAVSDGLADFALTACSSDREELQSRLLYSESMFVICHINHPLASQAHAEIAQLKDYPFIHFSPVTSIRQFIEGMLPVQTSVRTLEVQQMTTMMGLVAAGLGISVVPELTLYQFRHHDIAILPLIDCALQRDIHLVTRQGHTLSIAAQNFLDILLAGIEKKTE